MSTTLPVPTISQINAKIEILAQAEKITKKQLSELSRDLLVYVYDSNDVDAINRTIAVLTPMNKRTAALYFPTFVAWAFDETTNTFGKKKKAKVATKIEADATAFLTDETNDIWKWAIENINMEVKPKNYAGKITKLVAASLNDETDEGLELTDLVKAILASEAVSLNELVSAMSTPTVTGDNADSEEPAK